jgi:ribosomal protein L23
MHSTTIKIDGAKLRTLLENTANKTIYQIATESGYSKNVISNAIKKGYASSAVQNIARLYDITPDLYAINEPDPEPTEELKGQMSFDDLKVKVKDIIVVTPDELKALIKEAIAETFTSLTCKTLNVQYDERGRRYIATLFINKEDIKEGK